MINQGNFKGNNYFKLYYRLNKNLVFTKNYSRNYIVTVNRCRPDHYNLAASLARVNIVNNPTCLCNEYDEDINHVTLSTTDKERY